MSIDKNKVEYIATLAQLKLTEAELDSFTTQLNNILQFLEQLNELSLDGVLPTSHPFASSDTMRDDVVRASVPQELALANAPVKLEETFKVPAIFKRPTQNADCTEGNH